MTRNISEYVGILTNTQGYCGIGIAIFSHVQACLGILRNVWDYAGML